VDYKDTLNLPSTDFPMKADLARREPELLAHWEAERLYEKILEARKTAEPYVLHDGPPYANGHIHYGHILNKILKDIVCKYRTMAGHYVEYRPGWDCHGLPIELAVLRELGDRAKNLTPVEIRRVCHDYAMKWVTTQRDEFKRLGVFGTWDRPYLTLDKHYEATIVRTMAGFARNGLLFREKKPVHWCMSCRTALAEAEIEYDDAHTSPSIFVKFALKEKGLYAVIWTTTPWTLPANLAIAYHPEFAYVMVRARGERYLVAEKLADSMVKACGLEEEGPREAFANGRFVELGAAHHPFLERESVLLPAEYVTLEQGTGLVHTAPGHGADDYTLGRRHHLPAYAPVDESGRFVEGPWQGERVFSANPKIVAHLQERGALLSPPEAKVTHSYPICWRCKNPIIFRATWQWFAALDPKGPEAKVHLRQVALEQIGRTAWIPPWGENRIRSMIENRPDWVLSRQRVWGVPIPALVREGAGDDQVYFSPESMERIADLIEKEGVDAWYTRSVTELFGKEIAERHPDHQKSGDIVDVWFESGVSFAAVCEGQPGLSSARAGDERPVDLYLEGSDQHRGWFHSTLLVGSATRGRAPYRAVLTHGFVLDDRGRPYSKSEIEKARREGKKVEYIPPEEVLKQQGAELLRMWVGQADFRGDVAYSRAHLTQLGESYRKLRNTMRFLLGNLESFAPERDADRITSLSDPLDRYLAARCDELEARLWTAYDQFEFHVVLRSLVDFCTVDLSALYCDVRKDRLYCDPKDGALRRDAQAVLYRALRVLVRGMAPILCFTAEEVWQFMPKRAGDPPSVHLALMGRSDQLKGETDCAPLLDLRARVQKALEGFRAQKKSSLDAKVTVRTPDPKSDPIGRFSTPFLADVCIVSEFVLESGEPEVVVEAASGHRCERCWKWQPEQPLCRRCQGAVHPKSE
jgi:isoleucyl-tRNA synthetase